MTDPPLAMGSSAREQGSTATMLQEHGYGRLPVHRVLRGQLGHRHASLVRYIASPITGEPPLHGLAFQSARTMPSGTGDGAPPSALAHAGHVAGSIAGGGTQTTLPSPPPESTAAGAPAALPVPAPEDAGFPPAPGAFRSPGSVLAHPTVAAHASASAATRDVGVRLEILRVTIRPS